jgi:hypothetical protein
MLRRILVAPVVFLLAGCQPQQPPRTAAPAAPQGSIDLPATPTAHSYDAAIKPGEETGVARKAPIARAPAPARPPANALTERERQAIARWDREEAALNYDAPPLGLRPPPRTGVKLAMPADAVLPRPSSERTAPVKRSDTVLPPPVERPEQATPAEPMKVSAAVPPPSPPAPVPPAPSPPESSTPAARPEPPPVAAAPEPAMPPPASTPPQQTAAAAPPVTAPPVAAPPAAKPRAAAPADTAIPRPTGEPAATVLFEPQSADLSDGDRLLLERFARGTSTRRVRQILLYGYGGASDPVEARKLALARVLAVHAALIDLGLKADIEIGDFSQASDASPDRVDVMLR